MFFEQKIDRRSRNSMTAFLVGHARYWTMSSINRMVSYAQCVKLNRLGLTREQSDAAFELLGVEDGLDFVAEGIADFTRETGYSYTIGQNGRSGGYLVLYGCQRKDTGHRSRCHSCGQLNFKSVAQPLAEGLEAAVGKELLNSNCSWRDEVYLAQPTIASCAGSNDLKLQCIRRLRVELKDTTLGNRCGRCGAQGEQGRHNLSKPHYTLDVSMRPIDEDVNFEDPEEWSMDRLRNRVDLVCGFDRACDTIRDMLIDTIGSCRVVEKTIMVPKTVKVLECRT